MTVQASPSESMDYKNWRIDQSNYEFDYPSSGIFAPASLYCKLQPYESVIGDIETLHFTTRGHTTSITFLGTISVRAVELRD